MLATLALMTVVGGSDGWAVSERVVPRHLEAMTHQEQAASSKQDLPLTPEGLAASIELLAKSDFSDTPGIAFDPAFRKKLSKELVRLNQASEETIRKFGPLVLRPYDEHAASKLIFCRLLFLLRYCPAPKSGGFTRDDFYSYHGNLITPINVDGVEEYRDYPSLTSKSELTLAPRDYYDWPWRLTKEGWQIRWFTYRLGGDMQGYESMYNQFSKLPLRKGVNDKMALRGDPGLVHALRGQRAEVSPRARARVGLLEEWGE